MIVRLTRDSVCAGDDVDAPHYRELRVPDQTAVEEIVSAIAKAKYLASISGGKATWSIASRIPVAVIAEQWDEPRMLCSLPCCLDQLDFKNGVLNCHVNYHAQQDPGIVVEVLERVQLTMVEPSP